MCLRLNQLLFSTSPKNNRFFARFFFFTIVEDCRSQTNTNLHTDYCYWLLSISKGPQSTLRTFKSYNTVLKVSSRCNRRSVLHVSLTCKSYNRWRSGFRITKNHEIQDLSESGRRKGKKRLPFSILIFFLLISLNSLFLSFCQAEFCPANTEPYKMANFLKARLDYARGTHIESFLLIPSLYQNWRSVKENRERSCEAWHGFKITDKCNQTILHYWYLLF